MNLKMFHNPRCSKSRATLTLLQEQGLEPEVIFYLETPPDADELRAILKKLGRTARELMRTGEAEYREQGLDNSALSEEELITAMVSSPRLIERPIVLANGRAAIGRPPDSVLNIL